jgi:hypothetical protein
MPQELTSLVGRYGKHLTGSDAAAVDGGDGGSALDSLEFDDETRELLGLDDIEDIAAGVGADGRDFEMETADIERDAAEE